MLRNGNSSPTSGINRNTLGPGSSEDFSSSFTAFKEVEGSDKLYQFTVDFGEASPRNVMSGIKKYRSMDDILGKQFPFVTNLAPRTMMGKYVSEAMILAASDDALFSLFPTETKLSNGTLLR